MNHIKNFMLFENNNYNLPDDIKTMLTDDGNGNYLFYHYSDKKRDIIKPGSGDGGLRTSREEIATLSSVDGLAMYYTRKSDREHLVGPIEHIVSIPYNKVYYYNTDELYFQTEARKRFLKVRPGQAFNPNYELAWITKVANENGFEMTVAQWGRNTLRAQTTLTLKPISE